MIPYSLITRSESPDSTAINTSVDLAKRNFVTAGVKAALGAAVFGGVVVTSACGKNISIYTATVIGTLEELRPLLPNFRAQLEQAVAVAKTFDAAYREGKFVNAAALFENLTTIVSEIVMHVGVMSESVKLAVAVGGVALRAIAILLKSQASDPVVAAEVAKSTNKTAKDMIEQMSHIGVFNQIVELAMP